MYIKNLYQFLSFNFVTMSDKTLGLLQAFETQLVKRSFHTGVSRHNSINLNNEHLKELYRDIIAPVKAFNKDLILATCFGIRNLKERSLFFDR
jgi:hypothetical protein